MKDKIASFFKKKNVTLSPKVYFVKTMSMMAMGLFASLLMGTIFSTLFKYIPFAPFGVISTCASAATGVVLGVSIAYALEAPALVIFASGAVGYCANLMGIAFVGDTMTFFADFATMTAKTPGVLTVAAGPLGVFFCCIIAAEIGKLISKETKVDLLVTPIVTLLAGVGAAWILCPSCSVIVYYLGEFVRTATVQVPFLMGILISVVVGMILTLPISSAAICAMIGISGIAGGAAAVGCCAQMVGFAVISFRENRWGGLVAQGLGTSMLQMGNIVKNPRIWIPATLASAVTGPLSTCVFGLTCTGVSAGMGTCGLVSPLIILTEMDFSVTAIVGVLLLCVLLPAALSLLFDALLRRIGWIREGDMKLEL